MNSRWLKVSTGLFVVFFAFILTLGVRIGWHEPLPPACTAVAGALLVAAVISWLVWLIGNWHAL